MSDPDAIRADIEATRRNLGEDVDALADKVTPANIAHRQTEKVKSKVAETRDSVVGRVMGVVDDAKDKVGGARDRVSDRVGDARDHASGVDAKQSAADAKQSVVSGTAGHPLIAGLIAFGAGYLLSALLPSTQKEQELATEVKDAAAPLKEKVTEVAKEAAQNLKQPAQQAAQSVKETAQDAASTVKDEGTSAAQDVKTQAQDSAQQVRQA